MNSVVRGALWGVLVTVLLAVAVATWLVRRTPPAPPPPVLSEVPEFTLTGHDGETVTREDLLGRPWVADLIFTRCVLACPAMTGKMAILDRELPAEVRLVSVTVDPEHDDAEVLAEYAGRFEASDRWHFLTGERMEIYHLAGEGLRLPYDPNPPLVPLRPGDNIYHSTRFVLVDAEGRVRGYYETMEGNQTDQLRRDLEAIL
jgi:cytochrome oxidase Cu insertion factor (SCO1/SenC/PrrC family)